jgi:paraquat-inducible protein A
MRDQVLLSQSKRIARVLKEFIALLNLGTLLCGAATIAFPFAILSQFFTFTPSFGDPLVDDIIDFADPGAMTPKSNSVLGGIAMLFTDGNAADAVIAIVLLLFSVFFPAIKLALLWGIMLRPRKSNRRLVDQLEMLGPWSMADVFVVSVLLLAFKSFPGGTTFSVGIGYYFFLFSVVTSLLATILAKHGISPTADRD